MAGSASFNNLGAMSSGPADLFGLMAFNLRRTESSQMVISITEGAEQPMRSLWCGKFLLARPIEELRLRVSYLRCNLISNFLVSCIDFLIFSANSSFKQLIP